MLIGSYSDFLCLKQGDSKELSARVALGYDVAAEKQERKADAMAKIEAEKNAINVSELAAEYYARQIEPLTNTLTFSAAACKKTSWRSSAK
jgi:hypothetical protein